MAVFMTDHMPKYDPQDLPATVKRLHDYTVSLTEMLRFVLMNLDDDNVPELGQLSNAVQDAQGNLSKIEQTADSIRTRVENAEGDLSAVEQTAKSLTSRVESAEGNLSTLTQTSDKLAARVYSAEMGLSTLTVSARQIETRVADLGGNYSRLTQTVNGFETRVEDLSGKYSSLKQTVDGFDFTGMVTFRALEREGGSIINGDNITTGDLHISSDGIGALYFYNGAARMENIVGALEVYSNTYPDLFIESRNGNNIRILSDAQLALEAGRQGHIYLKADDYIQLRVAGRDFYFRNDGIYCGGKKIVSV